jgi:hypothetical protein
VLGLFAVGVLLGIWLWRRRVLRKKLGGPYLQSEDDKALDTSGGTREKKDLPVSEIDGMVLRQGMPEAGGSSIHEMSSECLHASDSCCRSEVKSRAMSVANKMQKRPAQPSWVIPTPRN